MGKFTLISLNLIFFSPFIILYLTFFYKKIIKYKKLLIFALIFGLVGYFIVEILATQWGAWSYNYSLTLGLRFGKSVLEILIWAMLIAPILAFMVSVFADLEEKHKV